MIPALFGVNFSSHAALAFGYPEGGTHMQCNSICHQFLRGFAEECMSQQMIEKGRNL